MSENKIPFPLSQADKTVSVLINEAVNQTLSRISLDNKSYVEATTFLMGIVGQTPLYMLITQDGITTYRTSMFKSVVLRDLIYAIHSSFIGRYGFDKGDLLAIDTLIARSACVSDPLADMELAPDVIKSRLYSYDTILEMVSSNTWLRTLGLIILYWNQQVVMAHAKAR